MVLLSALVALVFLHILNFPLRNWLILAQTCRFAAFFRPVSKSPLGLIRIDIHTHARTHARTHSLTHRHTLLSLPLQPFLTHSLTQLLYSVTQRLCHCLVSLLPFSAFFPFTSCLVSSFSIVAHPTYSTSSGSPSLSLRPSLPCLNPISTLIPSQWTWSNPILTFPLPHPLRIPSHSAQTRLSSDCCDPRTPTPSSLFYPTSSASRAKGSRSPNSFCPSSHPLVSKFHLESASATDPVWSSSSNNARPSSSLWTEQALHQSICIR